MSAQPLPKPEADPGDAEGWALLDALRRKLDDQGAQTRKATAQVAQLAESIAALVDAQRKRTRWLNLNSFVAYVVFTVLLGGAFYFVYQSRSHELVRRADDAVRRADDAVRRADDATAKLAARDAADAARAREVQQAKPPEVPRAQIALDAARASFKAGKFAETIAPLEQALAGEPNGARAAEIHYYLGIARGKTGDFDAAIAQLQTAIAGNVKDDDVHFQLALALDRAGEWAKSRAEYDRFAAEHPQSQFAPFALRRSASLARPPLPAKPAETTPPANAPASPPASPAPAPSTQDPPANP